MYREGARTMRRVTKLAAVTSGVCLAVTLAPAAAFAAGTGQNGFAASDYSTGFPTTDPLTGVGPVGLAFDASGVLYVNDNFDGNLYTVPAGGGAPTALANDG